MGAVPTTVNQAATSVDEIIQSSVYNAVLPIAEAAIIAEVPFLGDPIINQAFDLLMQYVAGKLYTALANYATITIIDIQTGGEETALLKAEGALRAAHLTGDINAISTATKNYEAAVASLIHFDGSASV